MHAEKSSTASMLNAMSEPILLDGPMSKLFSVCGKAVLFNDQAIEAIGKVIVQLNTLLKKYPAEQLTSEEMKRTRNSLEKLIRLLDGVYGIGVVKNENNNLNYFIGPIARDFYKSLDDKPSVNNDLAEEAISILCVALDENKFTKMIFPGWGVLVRAAYAGYTAVKGDQIQIATDYLKLKLHFYRGHKDFQQNAALITDVRLINERALAAREFASEKNVNRAIAATENVVVLLNKIKFKNLANAQQGLPLLVIGSVLLNLARCQIELTNKMINGAPKIASLGINMPPETSEQKYAAFIADIKTLDAKLLKECKRICTKPSSDEENRQFQDLQRKILELQPRANVHNIGLELLNRYILIVKAIDEQTIWAADPRAAAVLAESEAEIKGLMQKYTLDLTAKELSLEHKQVLSQPEPAPAPSPEEEPKVNPSASQTL